MKKSLATVTALGSILGCSHASVIFGGDFEMYKPGTSYGVSASWVSGFAQGIGDGLGLAGATSVVSYADGSPDGVSGDGVPDIDVPGWINIQSGNDLTNNGVGGSSGLNIFAAWGGDGRVQTVGSLGTIMTGQTITISVMAGGPAGGPIGGPLAFYLLADGTQLMPTSFVDPVAPDGSFQMISRTYDASALSGSIGGQMSIVLGVEDANDIGNRVIFDDVSLVAIPEPTSALLLGLSGMALAFRRSRKK